MATPEKYKNNLYKQSVQERKASQTVPCSHLSLSLCPVLNLDVLSDRDPVYMSVGAD